MDYKEIIDKLVKELSFRVGVPNIHNKEHQSIMSEILSEWGEYEVKDTIFEFLTEIDDDTEVTYQNKKGETKKTLKICTKIELLITIKQILKSV